MDRPAHDGRQFPRAVGSSTGGNSGMAYASGWGRRLAVQVASSRWSSDMQVVKAVLPIWPAAAEVAAAGLVSGVARNRHTANSHVGCGHTSAPAAVSA